MSLSFNNSTQKAQQTFTASTTPTVITLPTCVAGDLIQIFVMQDRTSNGLNAPSGYSTLYAANNYNLYYKIAGASEPNPSIASTGATFECIAITTCITGADQVTPINASTEGTASGGSNWTTQSLTTTADNCLKFSGGGTDGGTSDWVAGDEPPSITLIGQGAGTSMWLGLGYRTLGAAGATGTETPWENQVGSKKIFTWAVAPGNASSIDSLDEPLTVGGTHNITTTGLGTLTTATTVGGKAISSASATGGDGAITLAGFVAGQTYPAMGTQSVVASDGTNTASINRTLTTMTGWQYVVVSGLDTGEWSLGKAFGVGETPLELHVIDDGTGVLNADGTLTDWPTSGTFTCWARMASGGGFSAGEMVSFTFTVTSGGIEVGGGGIVFIGITSSGLTSTGLSS